MPVKVLAMNSCISTSNLSGTPFFEGMQELSITGEWVQTVFLIVKFLIRTVKLFIDLLVFCSYRLFCSLPPCLCLWHFRVRRLCIRPEPTSGIGLFVTFAIPIRNHTYRRSLSTNAATEWVISESRRPYQWTGVIFLSVKLAAWSQRFRAHSLRLKILKTNIRMLIIFALFCFVCFAVLKRAEFKLKL